MKSIKVHIIALIFIVLMPCLSYSQTEEIECLKVFNSLVHDNLSKLNKNNIDVSSNNLNIIFELCVSECGRIDSLTVRKSNLNDLDISETALISSLLGKNIPCIRTVYYKGELLPDKVTIVYNTKFLKEK